jgi:hypothetical protein
MLATPKLSALIAAHDALREASRIRDPELRRLALRAVRAELRRQQKAL